MGSLSFDSLIPPSLWLSLALAAAALLAWYAWRRPGMVSRLRWVAMIGLMACGLVLVLGILLNPTWVREIAPPPGKPLLTLLVDSSASMGTPDADRGATRYSAAALQAMELADALKGQFDVRVRTFATAAAAVGIDDLPVRTPTGDATDLATALLASLDEQRPQGQAVVLLSDGIHNVSGSGGGGATRVLNATRLAKAGATPVYTRTFGGQASGFDVALELRSSQDLAIINQKVPITARLSHHGMSAGRASVALLQDGREVARRDAQLMPGSPADVHFVVGQEKVGVYSYEVRVDPQTGEKTQANNSASYVLRVVDEPIRVLVLEGKPYWDSKFFMRTLGSDPAVALDSVVKVTDTRFMRRTLSNKEKTTGVDRKQPADRLETWKIVNDGSSILEDYNGIKPYQVVVLGRDAEAFLTDTAIGNLTNWISRDGGSLVCYRGAPAAQVNQRMARLLPVRWSPARESRFRVKLTDQGRDMQWLGAEATVGPAMLASMPPLATRAKIEQPKPLAVVLATSADSTGQESPTVVYQPYGSGRVVVIEGAGMWRWAFLPPAFQDHEQVYAGLWPSLLRWLTSGSGLAPGQQMTLRSDKVRFATSEPATATLLARKEVARGELPNIELIADGAGGAPAAQPKAFAPATLGGEVGVFRVNFGKLPAGRYQIRIAGSTDEDASSRAVFDVRTFGEEELNLEARPDLMARIAADSDGSVISGGSAGEIQAKFKAHFQRTRPPRVERASAWDRWWVLAGVVGLWGVSWAVRRSGGLV